MKLFSLFDRSHGQYGAPFHAPNEALAVRSFEEASMDQGSTFAKFPEEFTIFYVGEFNQDTGSFSPAAAPVYIQRAQRKAE